MRIRKQFSGTMSIQKKPRKNPHGAPSTNAFRTIVLVENSATLWNNTAEQLDFDNPQKSRSASGVELLQAQWSWLSWTAEAYFEYCRIAWDVFPRYEIALFGCDAGPEPIEVCSLEKESRHGDRASPRLRDLRLKMTRLMQLSKESPLSTDFSMNKVFRSVRSLETEEMLSVPIYRHDLANVAADQPFYLRLLIVTDDTDKQRMFTRIRRYIVDNNIGYMARYEVAILVIGVAVAEAPSYEKIDLHEEIYVTWYTAATGSHVVDAFKACLAWDLRLSRTVVTDIPMREDVKSGGGSTSVSYNVDLFHPCLMGDGGQARPGGEAERMMWVRPAKGAVSSLVPMENTQLIRASPSDPVTRPTQCLIGYVLDGNAVLLDSERMATKCKLFLCGGKICLQQLKPGTERGIDDISALSDLPGGRVSSYRVKETVLLLSSSALDPKSFPLQKSILDNHTKLTSYFPIVYTDTIVYLLPQFVPLLDAISAANPKDSDWRAAKDAIEMVLEMEKHGQTLPGISSHGLMQSFPASARKTESYAVIWAELDLLLESHSHRSLEHAQLRDYLVRAKRSGIREDLKGLVKSRLKSRMYNGSNVGTGSEGSVPVKAAFNPATTGTKRKARPEFHGRLKFGRFGKLYQNLPKADKNQRDDVLIHASIEL